VVTKHTELNFLKSPTKVVNLSDLTQIGH